MIKKGRGMAITLVFSNEVNTSTYIAHKIKLAENQTIYINFQKLGKPINKKNM